MKQIYHPWWKWECFKNGFYNNIPTNGLSHEDCALIYKGFLSDLELFEFYLNKVLNEWIYSCEHFLSNPSINKIAWLGQASLCLSNGIPSRYRYGYKYLNKDQQINADLLAERYYKKWKEKYLIILKNGEKRDTQKIYQMRFQWY